MEIKVSPYFGISQKTRACLIYFSYDFRSDVDLVFISHKNYIYIYIYIERERERKIDRWIDR